MGNIRDRGYLTTLNTAFERAAESVSETQTWASRTVAQIYEQARHQSIFKACHNDLLDHANTPWYDAQAELLNEITTAKFWNRDINDAHAEIFQTIYQSPTLEFQGRPAFGVNDESKNNVVKLIALLTGTYKEAESYRLPGSNGEKSIFDDVHQWPDTLSVVVHAYQDKMRNKTPTPPSL